MKYQALFFLVIINLFFSSYISPSHNYKEFNSKKWNEIYGPDFIQQDEYWIMNQIDSMTIEQKIAQLCFLRSSSVRNKKEEEKLSTLIKKYGIGGITFFKGNSVALKELVNKYQTISEIPLIYSIDGEWGASMRLSDTPKYPWMMTMGAVQNDSLIYLASQQMAEEFKNLGIHMNLAPDIDVNNNPLNPIINSRSFGENPWNVAKKGVAYMRGHQENGVMAVAKHFPGHGDTDMDSHLTLPTLNFDRKRLDSLELIPFQYLIQKGISSVMVAHLDIPKLTLKNKLPASVSSRVVDSLLLNELGFFGLTMTDGLAMKGVQDYYENGRLELESLKAGNDVLLLPQDMKAVIDTVKKGIETGEYSIEKLNKSVSKVLLMKSYLGIKKGKETVFDSIDFDKAEYIKETIMENAFTILKNTDSILPFRNLEKQKFALLTSGETKNLSAYLNGFDFYQDYSHRSLNTNSVSAIKKWLDKYKNREIIFSIHKSDENPWKSYKLSSKELEVFNLIQKYPNVHLVQFSNPYALYNLNFKGFKSVSVAYQNNKQALKSTAKILFGAIASKGKLPVTINQNFKTNTGISTQQLDILRKVNPQELNLEMSSFKKIDSIVYDAIKKEATPGCQLLVAKGNKVFFSKNYGHFTYDKKKKVDHKSIYDLASITKIASTIPNVMHLEEKGRLNLKDPLKKYGKDYKKSNKANLHLKEILSHQSGLRPWIPFYTKTLDDKTNKKKSSIYSSKKSSRNSINVASGIYLNKNYTDSIKNWILESELLDEKKYRYSDLGYYLIKDILKTNFKVDLKNSYTQKIYKSIGADRLNYLPKNSFSKNRIVPSEKDDYYRNQTLVGDVHDMGAAMQGGIGGHAGMFSTAEDLAKMMYLYLNKGSYGGKRYFEESTLEEFTACQFCAEKNRRAIGFDKPIVEDGPGGPTCELASKRSFGHTGFTGTMVWADPENDMIFVFLSNRTFPTMKNTKLIRMNVRTQLQEEFYKLLKN